MRNRRGPRHRGVNHFTPREASDEVVGLDWASQAHDVTVLDEAGMVLDR